MADLFASLISFFLLIALLVLVIYQNMLRKLSCAASTFLPGIGLWWHSSVFLIFFSISDCIDKEGIWLMLLRYSTCSLGKRNNGLSNSSILFSPFSSLYFGRFTHHWISNWQCLLVLWSAVNSPMCVVGNRVEIQGRDCLLKED